MPSKSRQSKVGEVKFCQRHCHLPSDSDISMFPTLVMERGSVRAGHLRLDLSGRLDFFILENVDSIGTEDASDCQPGKGLGGGTLATTRSISLLDVVYDSY